MYSGFPVLHLFEWDPLEFIASEDSYCWKCTKLGEYPFKQSMSSSGTHCVLGFINAARAALYVIRPGMLGRFSQPHRLDAYVIPPFYVCSVKNKRQLGNQKKKKLFACCTYL